MIGLDERKATDELGATRRQAACREAYDRATVLRCKGAETMLLDSPTVRASTMSDYRKLHVWRKAHALAINVHRDAGRIRGANYSSLRSQLIRAAMSIPANIVEGRSQSSERDFCRFLRYALNSASELEYHLTVARDIGILPNKTFTPLAMEVVEIRKMLNGLIKSIIKPTAPPLERTVVQS